MGAFAITMTRTTRRHILLGVGALLAGRPAAAARPADLPGWGETRWGMTPAALDRIFAGRIRIADPPLIFGPLRAARVVERVSVAGRPFVAFLQTGDADGRLAQVLLRYRGARPAPADGAAVRLALAEQLGRADEREVESDYSGSFPSFTVINRWSFATTRVLLRYTDPNGEAGERVAKELIIRYTPTRAP